MTMRSLLRYTIVEKAFQLATTLALVIAIAKALTPSEFAHWSTGLGIFLGLAPLLSLLPTEVLARRLNAEKSPYAETRAMVTALLCRSASVATVALAVIVALGVSANGAHTSLDVVAMLMALAGTAEVFGFAVALSLRKGAFESLMRGRALGLAFKLCLALSLFWLPHSTALIALAFTADSLAFAAWNCFHVIRSGQLRLSSMARYFGPNVRATTFKWCLKFFALSIPASGILTLYNFALRSDRFALAQLGLLEDLQLGTVCMQFIDPITLLFCGHMINLHLHGGRINYRLRLKLQLMLLACAAVAALLGPALLKHMPSNISSAAGLFGFNAWFIPAYGGFAMLFLSAFYAKGTPTAAYRGLAFITLALGAPFLLGQFASQPVYWAAPIIAAVVSLWIALPEASTPARSVTAENILSRT